MNEAFQAKLRLGNECEPVPLRPRKPDAWPIPRREMIAISSPSWPRHLRDRSPRVEGFDLTSILLESQQVSRSGSIDKPYV